MMRVVLLLVIALGLTGCERIGEYIGAKFNELVPSSSLEQDLKAEELYKALQQQNESQIKALVAPSLQAELQANPILVAQIMQLIPDQKESSMEVVSTMRSVDLVRGKSTTVTYSYQYPEITVQFTVVFQGVDDGTDIISFHVNTSAAKQQTDSEHADQQRGASQVKLREV